MASAVLQSVVPTPTPSPPTSLTPVSVASPATSVNELDSLEEEFDTINHLLQTRAKGHLGHEPIVAYPSSGTNYVYYSPQQVNRTLTRE